MWAKQHTALQPEMTTKIVPKTESYIAEMRLSKKSIPKKKLYFSESQTNTCNVISGKVIPDNLSM